MAQGTASSVCIAASRSCGVGWSHHRRATCRRGLCNGLHVIADRDKKQREEALQAARARAKKAAKASEFSPKRTAAGIPACLTSFPHLWCSTTCWAVHTSA